jgi:hypothetical protein
MIKYNAWDTDLHAWIVKRTAMCERNVRQDVSPSVRYIPNNNNNTRAMGW